MFTLKCVVLVLCIYVWVDGVGMSMYVKIGRGRLISEPCKSFCTHKYVV